MNYDTKKHIKQNCETAGMGFWFKTTQKRKARLNASHMKVRYTKREKEQLKNLYKGEK